MNTKLSAHGTRSAMTALAVLVTAVGMNVHGWSISGTVKNTSGAALSGVAVTVKDSAKYSDTTDASGNFKLESATAVLRSRAEISSSYSVRVVRGELLVRCPQDGALGFTLVNSLGRSVWTADAISEKGIARVAFPTDLTHGAVFLQIRHAKGVEYHSVVWGLDGLHIEPSKSAATSALEKSAAAAAAYPTLLFSKSDYRDTSITMTSETVTGLTVSMTSSQEQTCALPANPSWTSSGILVNPKGGSYISVKDPTIQKYNGKYLIYATVFNTAEGKDGTFQMEYIEFTDFSKADQATPYYMTSTSGFSGYKCAPELFYFEPDSLWYLIFQTQAPQYSTTKTPDKPNSWSTPKNFVSNWDSNWKPLTSPEFQYGTIDYYMIADNQNIYLFMTGDDGAVYRSKTSLANFPNGFGTPVIAKSFKGDKSIIFEGSSHYKIKGTTDTYLHVVEGMGGTGRVFSAWTSKGIEGTWENYRVGTDSPFAGKNNVDFPSGRWTNDISHGELIRDNPNQNMELDPCNLQFLFQGLDPSKENVTYNLKPYKLGLLTLKK